MKHIIAVVGMSGSGKTTMTQHIEKTLGIPAIVSYTTRPMREGETDGIEHWFVKPGQMPPLHTMLAYAYFGGNHYWTTHDQIPEDKPCTYVIDEQALMRMKANYGDQYNISAIFVQRDEKGLEEIDEARRLRDKDRMMYMEEVQYDAAIINAGTLEEFLERSEKLFKELYGNYGSTER